MTVVFLDRDGVINRNRDDYVRRVEEFEFLPGALDALSKLRSAGCTVVVISNQAGVGRGLIEPEELEKINRTMVDEVERHGGKIAAVYYCVHRKDEGCACRKPQPGLFHKASQDLNLELKGSYFIGDSESDVQAGHRAGCRTVVVLTGKSTKADIESWTSKPDLVAADLPSAVDMILAESDCR